MVQTKAIAISTFTIALGDLMAGIKDLAVVWTTVLSDREQDLVVSQLASVVTRMVSAELQWTVGVSHQFGL